MHQLGLLDRRQVPLLVEVGPFPRFDAREPYGAAFRCRSEKPPDHADVGQAFAADATLTTVVREGSSPNEIVLVAGGDALINPGRGDDSAVAGRAGLRDLADQVAKSLRDRGVRSVRLDVDESYAYGPTLASTWGSDFRPLGITGAVAMLGLSSQRARGNSPGPADPVEAVRALFARQLEARGLAEGAWEHPERRSKRYYRITDAGRAEYERLSGEIGPRLDRIAGSIEAIRSEILSPR